MRKTLLAAALTGVLAPTLAYGQSANVTMYGAVILSPEVIINIKQDTPDGAKQNIYRVSSNISRFGLRGTESLGGGLNAIFQIESSVNADNSGGTIAGRDTFAGLQGSWGTAKIGYFFSPYYEIGGIFANTPTFRTGILAMHNLWANNGYNGANLATGSFATRHSNAIRYDSPVVGGFQGIGMISGRDVGGDGGDINQQRRHAYIVAASGTYRQGPFAGGLAFEQRNNLREGIASNPKLDDKGLTLTASWDFGIVKVAGAYERLQYELATGGDLKSNYWAISATANLGPGQLYAAYSNVGDSKGDGRCVTAANVTTCPRVGAMTVGPDSGAQSWEISYTYPLSKRTLLYGGYIFIDNDRNAAFNFGNNPIGNVCTGNARNAAGNNLGCGEAAKPQGLTLGIAHFF